MIDFILGCMLLAIAVFLGGIILSLLWTVIIGIIAIIIEIFRRIFGGLS